MLRAAIETGGTKVLVAVSDARAPHTFVDTLRIPALSPAETLPRIREFLAGHARTDQIESVGCASFGPFDTDPDSPHYGWIKVSPKPGWQNVNLWECLQGLNVGSAAFVTDVSGSLIGERALGAGRGCDDVCYVTVGTGIGVGAMVGGRLVTGRGAPELGHIFPRRHPNDVYPGGCAIHGDCLEGLAAGPTVNARWGAPAQGNQIDIIAYYIAQLVHTLVLAYAPQRIIIGGGVAKTPGLLGAVRSQAGAIMRDYLGADHPLQHPESGFIVAPELGDYSGLHGAMELAGAL